MGNTTRERLENFRGYGGTQSYPSRTKDDDDVDFSTGSVGLGVAMTSFASLVQDYITAKAWGRDCPQGRMVALMGDAELDEGNIHECLQEGWKNGLRNVWWVIDYNRQSLDAVAREGLWQRIEKIFEAFGWDVVRVKYGALQRAAFKEPGGDALRAVDRPLSQPALFGTDVHGRRRLAAAADGRAGRPGRGDRADRPPQRRRTRRTDGKSGRQLRADHGRHVRRDRP